MIITSAHNNSIMGIVTLLLPSVEPQIFENTIQLYSTDGGRNVSCIHKKISVPGPWLNEYQEGPGIEKPIRKRRPKGQYHSCSRFKTRLIKSKIWRITLYQKAHITQPFWNPCVDSRQSYSDKVHGAIPDIYSPNAVIVSQITGMWSNLVGTTILRRFQRLADDGEFRYTSVLQIKGKCI